MNSINALEVIAQEAESCNIVSLGTHNNYDIELVTNADKLPKLEQKKLVKELNSISVEAFDKATPIEETWDRTVFVDQIYLIKKEDNILGYATNDFMNLDGEVVNYFSSALFRQELQSKGMYNIINQLRLAKGPTKVIMTRTQNPVVITGFKRLCDSYNFNFFPNGSELPDKVLNLARDYHADTDNHLICKGVYGRALMEETPSPKTEVESLFNQLNVDKGDALILIGTR